MAMSIDHTCLHLFVPADRPERIAKAAASGADAVIIDLEDAVGAAGKALARTSLAEHLVRGGVPLILRINGVGTAWHAEDVEAAAFLPLDAVMLPKAENEGDIGLMSQRLKLPVIALVESAAGIHNALAIARSAARLAFGSVDYAADLSMGHTRQSLLTARSHLVLVSRLAGIPAPIDGVTTSLSDEDVILADSAHSVEMGFSGKLLIHPAQIKSARAAFAPDEKEVEWATRVLAFAQENAGAVKVDGEMIDAPVIMRARQIVNRSAKA
ncbi:citrate lyase subunit beta/citryl-CoA lyase [Neorhizobium alkalisoli]|uniref:Citrate lyase subunit beta/citryl-CoA lyase n=2 Tax=Neorhizobium alkalisoli TaxID=528178 RepID=A0A561R9C8_9HYPH|nr:citrate lyase subunit beta/citryl-CoA lyase [Neorhizobium alkalisoli]